MQAKDVQLIQHATDLRLRAERRAGELLAKMKERGGDPVRDQRDVLITRRATARRWRACCRGSSGRRYYAAYDVPLGAPNKRSHIDPRSGQTSRRASRVSISMAIWI
jgi:hypothetical protein